MMAGAKVKARVPDSKLYSLLRAHVLLAEGMLHLSHLGHQVGRVDEFRLGVAAGHDDVQHLRALAEKVHHRSEEHTSELQSLMRISYAVFCLKKKTKNTTYI